LPVDVAHAVDAAQRHGDVEIDDGAPSSWRPPWFDTTIASAPVLVAMRASSTSSTPLIMSFPGHRLLIHSTSFHDSAGSNCVEIHDASDATLAPLGV
jgi:hypothetical protein